VNTTTTTTTEAQASTVDPAKLRELAALYVRLEVRQARLEQRSYELEDRAKRLGRRRHRLGRELGALMRALDDTDLTMDSMGKFIAAEGHAVVLHNFDFGKGKGEDRVIGPIVLEPLPLAPVAS
jgi:hypothetical protein